MGQQGQNARLVGVGRMAAKVGRPRLRTEGAATDGAAIALVLLTMDRNIGLLLLARREAGRIMAELVLRMHSTLRRVLSQRVYRNPR